MVSTAKLSYVRMSSSKIRLVANLVKGKQLEDALTTLRFSNKKAAKLIDKVVRSAMANAERTKEIDVDNLVLSNIKVEQGPTLKRFLPRAMGRATKIRHRTSHIIVTLEEI